MIETDFQIDDPRHPLQMDLSAAQRHVKKWLAILDSIPAENKGKEAWARAHLAYHKGRVEGFKRLIKQERSAS